MLKNLTFESVWNELETFMKDGVSHPAIIEHFKKLKKEDFKYSLICYDTNMLDRSNSRTLYRYYSTKPFEVIEEEESSLFEKNYSLWSSGDIIRITFEPVDTKNENMYRYWSIDLLNLGDRLTGLTKFKGTCIQGGNPDFTTDEELNGLIYDQNGTIRPGDNFQKPEGDNLNDIINSSQNTFLDIFKNFDNITNLIKNIFNILPSFIWQIISVTLVVCLVLRVLGR